MRAHVRVDVRVLQGDGEADLMEKKVECTIRLARGVCAPSARALSAAYAGLGMCVHVCVCVCVCTCACVSFKICGHAFPCVSLHVSRNDC